MEIKRDIYLNKLIDRKQNGMVKVITGIRRCGKSFLLFKLFYGYLLSIGVKKSQIIMIELDQVTNAKYRNPFELDKYLRAKIENENEQYYIFIDEIQFVSSVKNPYLENGEIITFYDVLNGLMCINNVDVYVTGSNSKMLSKDILTEFRGRGDEIQVRPLAFSEFMSIYDGDKYSGWLEYYTFGGLPAICNRKNDEEKIDYLHNLFTETYMKDIVERNNVRNTQDLEELLNVLSSSIGSLTNPTKLERTFKSAKNNDISRNTIDSYLKYFEDSFLINKAMRYDVKGRKYIGTTTKYYFSDLGLRNVRLNFRQQEENHIMENIIYNELLYRGCNVDVGVVEINEKQADGKYLRKSLEVDFIASSGINKYYIQSALALPSEEKREQEQKSLTNIKDSFKKIIVTKDNIKLYKNEQGIVYMSIFDFLLIPNSLEV